MSVESEILYATVGRRIAELRKQKGLSQVELAASLSRRRTQAWISTVESGRRNVNAYDLVEFAAALDTSIGELFSGHSQPLGPTPKSLNGILNELGAHLPIEMPVYLQRDLGQSNPDPIDYQYASTVPGRLVFNANRSLEFESALSTVVIERSYVAPNLEPTDFLTYSKTLIPHPDPDVRVADRILIKLEEPYDGRKCIPV